MVNWLIEVYTRGIFCCRNISTTRTNLLFLPSAQYSCDHQEFESLSGDGWRQLLLYDNIPGMLVCSALDLLLIMVTTITSHCHDFVCFSDKTPSCSMLSSAAIEILSAIQCHQLYCNTEQHRQEHRKGNWIIYVLWGEGKSSNIPYKIIEKLRSQYGLIFSMSKLNSPSQ